MNTTPAFKIGLFGIGLDTYWPQFEGLKERLEGYLNEVHQRIAALHPDIVNAGLVDTADKAFEAGHRFRTEGVNIIFLYVTTYALFINRIACSATGQSACDRFEFIARSCY